MDDEFVDAGAETPPADQPPPETSGRRMNDQVRQLIMKCGELAQRIPEAQQEFGAAAKALTAASLKIVSSEQTPSPEQPVIGA